MNHEQLVRYLSNYTNQRHNICFVAGSTSLPVSLRKSVNVLLSAWSFKRKSPPSSNNPEKSSWNGHGCLCKEVRCCTGTWWGCRQHLSSLGLKSCAPSGLRCSFDVGWGWETVSVGRAQLSRLWADRLDLPSLQPELCTGSQVAQLILQAPSWAAPAVPRLPWQCSKWQGTCSCQGQSAAKYTWICHWTALHTCPCCNQLVWSTVQIYM